MTTTTTVATVKVASKSSVLLSTGVSLIKSGIAELLSEIGKGISDALTITKIEAPTAEADLKAALSALEARVVALEAKAAPIIEADVSKVAADISVEVAPTVTNVAA